MWWLDDYLINYILMAPHAAAEFLERTKAVKISEG